MRRIGSTPAERGSTGCNNCPDGIELSALRLLQAGVSVELHQWPATFHG